MADDDLISIASPFYTVLLQRGDGDDGDFEVQISEHFEVRRQAVITGKH